MLPLYISNLAGYGRTNRIPLYVEEVAEKHPEKRFHSHTFSELVLVLRGEAVHLVIQDGVDIVYIYKAEAGAGLGGMRMSSHVGLRIPMYCTGVGKAILATQSYGEAERVWRKSSIRALTAHTITDFDAFIEQLKRVRMAGYAIDDEENELGIRCVALAVPGMNGRAEAAFSISGLAAQMTDDRIEHLARMGLAARQDILRDLGWK